MFHPHSKLLPWERTRCHCVTVPTVSANQTSDPRHRKCPELPLYMAEACCYARWCLHSESAALAGTREFAFDGEEGQI